MDGPNQAGMPADLIAIQRLLALDTRKLSYGAKTLYAGLWLAYGRQPGVRIFTMADFRLLSGVSERGAPAQLAALKRWGLIDFAKVDKCYRVTVYRPHLDLFAGSWDAIQPEPAEQQRRLFEDTDQSAEDVTPQSFRQPVRQPLRKSLQPSTHDEENRQSFRQSFRQPLPKSLQDSPQEPETYERLADQLRRRLGESQCGQGGETPRTHAHARATKNQETRTISPTNQEPRTKKAPQPAPYLNGHHAREPPSDAILAGSIGQAVGVVAARLDERADTAQERLAAEILAKIRKIEADLGIESDDRMWPRTAAAAASVALDVRYLLDHEEVIAKVLEVQAEARKTPGTCPGRLFRHKMETQVIGLDAAVFRLHERAQAPPQ